ncbi:hypothetical protein ACFQE1_04615 [Halobium palmae]|uniref:ATP-binding protein n=1 Tax=Halobium palmae TaxID=1776492 RepID=A0ABD5RXD6_9EURY
MATDYLRAHYATYGHLDDVVYFDCATCLPAFSFFDVRDELAAGVPRTTAVEDTVDHYLEILTGIMGRERFEQAVRSPDVIRYLIKAAFDPVHGADSFSHRSLHGSARRMHERKSAPAVSDPDLERMLGGVVANRARSYDEIMQGVANRLEKVPVDQRLAAIFNHVPEDGDPHFDLAHYLNEDVVIVIDTGGLRTEAQRVLTLVILSNLWTALRRRKQRSDAETDFTTADDPDLPQSDEPHAGSGVGLQKGPYAPGRAATHGPQEASGTSDRGPQRAARQERAGDSEGLHEDTITSNGDPTDSNATPTASDPLVNLYVEEAASVANSGLLTELLAQSRGFDCAVTLAMQFPAQLRTGDERVYEELLNNVSTVVTGNVPVDRRLTERFATDDMPPELVGNRLRALRRGQWFVRLPADFGDTPPRPFLVESLPLPPGDLEGAAPLDPHATTAFERALRVVADRTRREAGLTLAAPSTVETSEGDDEATDDSPPALHPVLAYTKRLPSTVEYAESLHALRCTGCDNRYDPSIDGMRRAVECCSSLADVDRDDVPVCTANLKLTPEERLDADWSTRQLLFLQVVYNAQQLRYDDLEYDLLHDSMIRLQEYVGIESDAVQDLVDADLLRHDTDHPHRLYTVTPDGRAVIGESYRQGVDYGHGAGDLEESSLHVLSVEVGRRFLVQEYVDDTESAVVEVIPYYDLDGHHRLDLAGVDADGTIRVALEVERINHDFRRAVPEDFDKMAECDLEAAIWIVMTRQGAHDVLHALRNPLEGEPRIEKSYSQNTAPRDFKIDTPGLTAVYTVEYVRDTLLD